MGWTTLLWTHPNWDYHTRTVNTSIPGYIAKALTKICITTPHHLQHSPHAWIAPNYGTKIQYTDPDDNSAPLTPDAKTCLQEIIGTLLYWGRAIDSTTLVGLRSLATPQTNGTKATTKAIIQLLNY
jgi:hypothetical protein